MHEKAVLSLFIFCSLHFCVFLSRGVAILSTQKWNTSKGNDDVVVVQVRKKRVINETPNENKPVNIQQVPYIVNILHDGISHCAGSILTERFILTAAHCFLNTHAIYKVLSGSSRSNQGKPHNIIRTLVHSEYRANANLNDIALIFIFPPIDFTRSPNRKIGLHSARLPPPNTLGTVSGWGCNGMTGRQCNFPTTLRSMTVPIISEEECSHIYRNLTEITGKDVCTLDKSGLKCCGIGDSGAPLVVNNRLIGLLSWGGTFENRENPDVFINLSHHEYRTWIISNLLTARGWRRN